MDIRVKKTKRAIQKAFVALLREKPIEKITVKAVSYTHLTLPTTERV